MGRLLLYDIPHDRLEAETTRLRSVRAYLRDRPKAVFQSLLQLPGPSKTVFDTTVMDKLGTRCESRLVGVIREIEISRAGSLTCPVASGVVLAGVWDRTKLEGCTPQEAAHKLQEASQGGGRKSLHDTNLNSCSNRGRPVHALYTLSTHASLADVVSLLVFPRHAAPIVAQFNGIDSLEALAKVVHGQKGGGLQLAAVERTSAGVVVQFKEESGAADEEPSDVLIRWRPLFWFRFNSREEAAAAQALVPAAEPGVVLGGDHAPEAAAGAGAVAPAAAVAGPSGGNGEAAPAHAGPTSGDGALSSSESSGGESSHMGTESSEASQFSDEDMEEMQQGQEMQFAEGPDEAFEEIEMGPDRTVGCNRLTVTLTQQCAATALLVKMVDQENLMEELEDLNPYPNIDMTYVVAKGKRVALPAGVQARP